LSSVTVTIPGGTSGVRAANGEQLAANVLDNFQIIDGSILRVQQLLSLLDYSPLSFTPTGSDPSTTDSAAQIAALYSPPTGTFSWRQSGWPSELTSLWKQGVDGVMTQGLIMEFEADHGLDTDGKTSGGLWNDLVTAISAGQVNTGGYNYALGSKIQPESLTIWHNGKAVVKTTANTGATGTPTPDGNFPVYARYRNQVMKGLNPDGSHYADPVQFVAYFHAGDAVHYLNRADYGIPQSLGCIELPLASAAKVWPYLAYGTIVSVIG
jgi:peptidoglycan hydrolase-like protein with peptidoglycan-binding domain